MKTYSVVVVILAIAFVVATGSISQSAKQPTWDDARQYFTPDQQAMIDLGLRESAKGASGFFSPFPQKDAFSDRALTIAAEESR